MMQAVNCVKYSSDPKEALQVQEVPRITDAPSEGYVTVQVLACFVDFVQVLLMQNKYQMKLPTPFTLGQEFTGRVVAVGPDVDDLKVGDLVMGRGFGCMVEMVQMNAAFLLKLPSDCDPARVPSTYSYITSIHALKDRAKLKAGETLLVLGASGGVGSTAIEIGKLLGARVIAAASTSEKLETCKRLGADYTVNYDEENLKVRVREITKGEGANVVFDPVGDKYCQPAVRALAWRGRYIVIGFAAGDIPKIPANLILLKEASIIGSAVAEHQKHNPAKAFAERQEMAELFAAGKLKPFVSQILPFQEAPRAFQEFLDRKVQGKVVLVTRSYEKEYMESKSSL